MGSRLCARDGRPAPPPPPSLAAPIARAVGIFASPAAMARARPGAASFATRAIRAAGAPFARIFATISLLACCTGSATGSTARASRHSFG